MMIYDRFAEQMEPLCGGNESLSTGTLVAIWPLAKKRNLEPTAVVANGGTRMS